MLRWVLGSILVLAALIATGTLKFTGVAPWSAQPAPVQEAVVVSTPMASPTATAMPASTPVAVAVTLAVCPCPATPTATATPTPMPTETPTPPAAAATPRPVAKAVPAPYTAPAPAPVQCAPRTYPERRAGGFVWVVTRYPDCSFSEYPVESPTPTPAEPQPAAPATIEPERPYDQTGKGETRRWTLSVPSDWVLIVGGYRIEGRKEEGVYKAYGGDQKVTVTVTDGFYRMVPAEAGHSEFCNRVRQARQMGWALSVMEPLPGWPPAC